MNELRGKYVNVVLGVEAGKEMEFLQHPVYIVAHFNGRTMESDSVPPESGPDFNTELVWETEKKVIRKVRSTNSPLRVECFSVDSHGQKECVGFTLLSLRSAYVISSNDNTSEIPTKWYKLMGVPQAYKKARPELFMSLTLRDHCLSSVIPPALSEFPHPSLEHYANGSKTVIPIRFIDGGYIRIGHENDKADTYDLKIIVTATSNLHLLMPKDVVFAPTNKNRFYVTFSMFGINVNTKPFYNDPNELIALKDNIVIKLVAGFDILKLFFGQFDEVLVTFSHGENKLGSTKIHMEKLLADMDEVEFKEQHKACVSKEQTCVFNCEEEVPADTSDPQPFINVEIVLCAEKEKMIKICEKATEEEEQDELVVRRPEDPNGSGDQNRSPKERSKYLKTTAKEEDHKISDEIQGMSESFQQYALEIVLESLLWKKHSRENIFHVKFNHPQAATSLLIKTEIENVVGRNILLESLHCKLIYVSTPARIANLLKAWPPKLVIHYDNGQQLSEELSLNTSMLSPAGKNYADLLRSYTGDVLANVKIWMSLKECGLNPILKSNYELEPQVLDDIVVTSELRELEQWKDDVKKKFELELKDKEKTQLAGLIESWTERKGVLEKTLLKNVGRCKSLSKELQKATNSVRIQQTLLAKQKALTFQDLHDEIRKNTMKYSICDNHELIEKLSTLEKENEFLKELLCEQTQEINSIKKYSLSNEQTANLLQEVRTLEEKLAEAQKFKAYFKDQYSRAVKEIHELKSEGQKNMQSQLQLKKEELSQLSLDKFFETQRPKVFDFSEDVLKSEELLSVRFS